MAVVEGHSIFKVTGEHIHGRSQIMVKTRHIGMSYLHEVIRGDKVRSIHYKITKSLWLDSRILRPFVPVNTGHDRILDLAT